MHIISINVKKRVKEVPDVQKVLTEFGDSIISRIGLHNIGENKNGLIIVVFDGKNEKEFTDKLEKIENVSVKSMKI